MVSGSAVGSRTDADDLTHDAVVRIFDWDDLVDMVDGIAGTVTSTQPGSGIVLLES